MLIGPLIWLLIVIVIIVVIAGYIESLVDEPRSKKAVRLIALLVILLILVQFVGLLPFGPAYLRRC